MKILVNNPDKLIDEVAKVFESDNCFILDITFNQDYIENDGLYIGPEDELGIRFKKGKYNSLVSIFTEKDDFRIMAHIGTDYAKICCYKDTRELCKILYPKQEPNRN